MKKIVYGIIFLCVSPFLFIGLYGLYSTHQSKKNLIETEGTVVGNVLTIFGDATYAPAIKFSTQDSTEIIFTGSVGANPPMYEIGEKVDVLYDSNKPQEARIKSFMELWFGDVLFISIALFVFTIAYLVLRRLPFL